jgi:hypothetical protein
MTIRRIALFSIGILVSAVTAIGFNRPSPPPEPNVALLLTATNGGTVAQVASCLDTNGSVSYYEGGALTPIGGDADLAMTPPGIAADSFFATADQLMPQWGLYPNAGTYGTPPLSTQAGFGNGRLTWIVNFARTVQYQVWIRAADGQTTVKIDDQALPGIAVAGGTYTWTLLGTYSPPTAGPRYIDIDVAFNGIFDAILFTDDASYNPQTQAPLASWHVKTVTATAQRVYRALPFATSQRRDLAWLVTSPRRQYDEDVDDWNPPTTIPSSQGSPTPSYAPFELGLWGAADQYINGAFEVVAGPKGADVSITMSPLVGPNGAGIAVGDIDLRVAKSYQYLTSVYDQPPPKQRLFAKPLLHDDRGQKGAPITGDQGGFGGNVAFSRMGAFNNRLFWLTVHARKGLPAGTYTGTLQIVDSRNPCLHSTVAVQLQLLPLDLQPVQGAEGIMYLGQPAFNGGNANGVVTSASQFRAELADLAAHGLNSVSSYGGVSISDSGVIPADAIAAAGLTHTVIDIILPEDGAEGTPAQVTAYAQSQGISEVVFWTVDEPQVTCKTAGCQCPNYTLPQLQCHYSSVPSSTTEPCTWLLDLTLYYLCDRKAIEPPIVHSTVPIQNTIAFNVLLGGVDPQFPALGVVDRPIILLYNFGPTYTAAVKAAGGIPYSYRLTEGVGAPIYLRAAGGIFNRALGYEGQFPWAYRDPASDIFVGDMSQGLAAMTYPDQHGLPIPTRNWEAHRAGIDDVRYIQALQRAIDTANGEVLAGKGTAQLPALLHKAQTWMSQNYSSIPQNFASSFWYYSMATDETTLDASRRQAADLVVQINANLIIITELLVQGADHNLWLASAQNGNWGQVPPPRQHIDGNVFEFQASSVTQIFVLGTDGNLWLASAQNGNWGQVPPPRQHIDANVTYFQIGPNPNVAYVLGDDRNLWYIAAPAQGWGQGQPSRQQIDGNVGTFHALSATQIFVLGTDGNLWLEFAQNGNWGQVPPPRQHVDANVAAFKQLSATQLLVLGKDLNLWLASAQNGNWGQVPPPRQFVDGNVGAFQALSPTEIFVSGPTGLWYETAPAQGWGKGSPVRQLVEASVSQFQALSSTEVLLLDKPNGNLWYIAAPAQGWGQGQPSRQQIDGNVQNWALLP